MKGHYIDVLDIKDIILMCSLFNNEHDKIKFMRPNIDMVDFVYK